MMLKRFAGYKLLNAALFRRWVWRTLLCDGILGIALLVGLSTAYSAEQNAASSQIGSPDVHHLTQVLRDEL
ncbi:MAG: hypothetical protein L3J63_00895 [Geopsychrobacter sp.]|nr:hypothetical protein [Geopsychrobacter sp.]